MSETQLYVNVMTSVQGHLRLTFPQYKIQSSNKWREIVMFDITDVMLVKNINRQHHVLALSSRNDQIW